MQNKPVLKKCLIELASYYGAGLGETQMETWLVVISDCDPVRVREACLEFMRDPSQLRMPTAAQIRERAHPELTSSNPRDIANEVAGRIWRAISKFGSYRSDEALEYIGELGSEVVQRMGGWSGVCKVTDDERGIFFAQCRDVCESVQRLAKRGALDHKFALPSPNSDGQKIQTLIGSSVKGIS